MFGLDTMKIGTRLGLSFSVVVGLLFVCAGISFEGMQGVAGTLGKVAGPGWDTADGVMEFKIDAKDEIILTQRMMLAGTDAALQSKLESELRTAQDRAREAMDRVKRTGFLSESDVAAAEAVYHSFGAARYKLREAQKAAGGDRAALTAAEAGFTAASDELFKALEKFEEVGDSVIATMVQEAQGAEHRQIVLLSVITLLAAVVGLGATMFGIVRIARPIARAAAHMHEIAQGAGDLTVALRIDSKDELGELGESFNAFVAKIRGLVVRVSDAVGQLSTAATQVNAATSGTSGSVHEQASETDQVASAVLEMSAAAQEVARNAVHAADATADTNAETQRGQQVVTGAIRIIEDMATEVANASAVIERLKNNSAEIGKITDVISGIADQTNLLALNAAIEAARAGENGRGFAVVADEVRTLAQRTRDSTSEIQKMIESLQDGTNEAAHAMEHGRVQAEQCVQQANHAHESLNAISSKVAHISNMNTQIATAAEEQRHVTEEISRNITAIKSATDRTAESAQQLDSASAHLTAIASDLKQVVGSFRI
ncbi:MAG: methyl-accepting chemotaxis protein [Gammaproteobacteria bacterium]|nr:methyl-accepting chemotaxis protein [Gammaproteobacteria bacterium]